MSKAEPSSGNASQVQMESVENQIVVYQPNETVRLDVRLENETVWLNQARLAELFCVDRTVVNRHTTISTKLGNWTNRQPVQKLHKFKSRAAVPLCGRFRSTIST